jgi:hypothetical protein
MSRCIWCGKKEGHSQYCPTVAPQHKKEFLDAVAEGYTGELIPKTQINPIKLDGWHAGQRQKLENVRALFNNADYLIPKN